MKIVLIIIGIIVLLALLVAFVVLLLKGEKRRKHPYKLDFLSDMECAMLAKAYRDSIAPSTTALHGGGVIHTQPTLDQLGLPGDILNKRLSREEVGLLQGFVNRMIHVSYRDDKTPDPRLIEIKNNLDSLH